MLVCHMQNYGGFTRMTAFCKTRVPAALQARVEAAKDDDAALKELGIAVGTELSRAVLAHGAPGLHFYTLNTEAVTIGILENLGLRKA